LDDPEFKENITNLRRNSIQELFNGYYFDYQLAEIAQQQKELMSQEAKIKGVDPPGEGEGSTSILDNPDLLLQQFNHQISIH
jgi:hypothetical protein